MNSLQTLFQWIAQSPFTSASVLVGGSILVVTLYTYVHDYRMLIDRVSGGAPDSHDGSSIQG